MPGYYDDKLSADRLARCYAIAPPRVQRYLAAEIRYVARRIRPSDDVLELGCGYGRVLAQLAPLAKSVVGVDTSEASLELARGYLAQVPNCRLVRADAVATGFPAGAFDVVVCIQNGVSAFHADPRRLIAECIRVARPGGRVLLSSYAPRFWPHRLRWFELQAQEGLIGAIDYDATGDGTIVCTDGFRATTVSPEAFRALTAGLNADVRIEEVDASSIFCEIRV